MKGFDAFEVTTPRWMQILLPFAVIAFLVLGIFLFHYGYVAVAEDMIKGVILILLGAFMFYISYVGYDLTKYSLHKAFISEENIEIKSKKGAYSYGWKQVSFNSRDFCEVLELYDQSKRKIYAVDYKVPNVRYLIELLERRKNKAL